MKKPNIQSLLAALTLEEKAALCSGINSWDTTPIARLGIPSVSMADGPHGVRKEIKKEGFGNIFTKSIPATCFPPAVTLASTWDTALIEKVGVALGEECLEQEVSVILGPGINIKRSPLCGRNFEYFSEDPYLTGELAAAYINGVQKTGVGTSLKHYAANSQEHKRHIASSEVDERALREIYLAGFETAVKKAQPYTVMCCYNPVNGVHGSDNAYLLTDILRGDFGFEGIVVSDWGAVNDRVKAIFAGMNLEMPTSNGEGDADIVRAVKDGTLPIAVLDGVVEEILEFVYRCYAVKKKNAGYKADFEAHHKLARRAAAEATVLLKNDGGMLPLKPNKKFAVVGRLAKKIRAQGSGSSQLDPKNLVSFTEALDAAGIGYDYAPGYSFNSDKESVRQIKDACDAVVDKDYVILFIGLTEDYESESFDRTHLEIPPMHIKLLEEIYKKNKNIAVVLTGGSPVAMPWLSKAQAMINVYLGGEGGGEAAMDVLFGAVNPSGKLAETYPLQIEDVLATPYFGKDVAEYRESVFVGYRLFDTAQKSVLFPFGFGMSYTSFAFSDLKLSAPAITEDDTLTVEFTLTNTGRRAGAEVAQLYVRDTESTIYRPDKELKGFQKVFLMPGESKTVSLVLDKRSFAFYNVLEEDWTVESGAFEILVGASSRDIRLSQTVTVTAVPSAVPDYRASAPAYYDLANAKGVSRDEFEAVLGRQVHEFVKPLKGNYGMNTVVGDLDGTFLTRAFRAIFRATSTKLLPKNASRVQKKMTRQGAMYMPVRNFYMMSAGAFSKEATFGILEMFNGRFFHGLSRLIRSFRKPGTKKSAIYKFEKEKKSLPELIAATNNAHKLKEIRALLSDTYQVLSLKDAGFSVEIEETGATFYDNALLKAKTIFEMTGKPVIADDSGLEVYALNDAPGVFSARYAGEPCDDEKNNDKLLTMLADTADRAARFVSVVVLYAGEGQVHTGRGYATGIILKARRGTGGFGYDPLFLSDELNKTFAEITPEEKNAVSHRAKALAELKAALRFRPNAQ